MISKQHPSNSMYNIGDGVVQYSIFPAVGLGGPTPTVDLALGLSWFGQSNEDRQASFCQRMNQGHKSSIAPIKPQPPDRSLCEGMRGEVCWLCVRCNAFLVIIPSDRSLSFSISFD